MHTLVSLPLDVKTVIFSYVRRRVDLKALYETCKDSYAIVIPRVYRSVTLSEEICAPTLCAFLNLENQGLQHLRHLNVIAGCSKLVTERARYDTTLHMLANQLPRDMLLSFKYVLSFIQTAMLL